MKRSAPNEKKINTAVEEKKDDEEEDKKHFMEDYLLI